MFGHYTYLLYNFIFTLPLIAFLWWRHSKILRKSWQIILIVTMLATIYGYFIWPLGLRLGTWGYSPEKILNITFFGTHVEDFLWWALVTFLISSFTVISAKEEDSHLKNFIKQFLKI